MLYVSLLYSSITSLDGRARPTIKKTDRMEIISIISLSSIFSTVTILLSMTATEILTKQRMK